MLVEDNDGGKKRVGTIQAYILTTYVVSKIGKPFCHAAVFPSWNPHSISLSLQLDMSTGRYRREHDV